MDATQALADLTEISSQIEAAVLFGEDGSVEASTLSDEHAAETLARGAVQLLASAAESRSDAAEVTQLEAETGSGSVFVVRDGARRIAAVTGPKPTVGLVFYDLKKCLRDAAAEPAPAPRKRTRRTTTKKADAET
jgi:predicted regulator of Ras-like GTPase activity (Roadblock/LC7/MglB family)